MLAVAAITNHWQWRHHVTLCTKVTMLTKPGTAYPVRLACPAGLRIAKTTAFDKTLFNTQPTHNRKVGGEGGVDAVTLPCTGCSALLMSCCYAYLEVLNELFKAGHMSSCLHSCSSFFVSCSLFLSQLPVKHPLQPLLQVALLHQLPPAHPHPLCMCLNPPK